MNFDLFNGKKSAGTAFSFFFCLYIFLAFFGQNILLLFTKEGTFAYKFINTFFSPIALISTCILFARKKKDKLLSITSVKKFNYFTIILSILVCFGMYFGVGLANLYLTEFIKEIGLKTKETTVSMNNVAELVCFIISIALLPAICEEMFFRGLLNNLLGEEKTVNRILFTSLCFALFHINVSQLIYQFIFGVFFALLYELSKSIIPCIISHFINNSFILIMLYLKVDIMFLSYSVYMIICGILALVFVVLFVVKKSQFSRQNGNESINGAYVYASFGIVFTVLTIILNMVA